MATKTEPDQPNFPSTPKLPLFTKPLSHTTIMDSPERSGMATPPLQTNASVPFRWEEQPGKPRQRTILPPTNPTAKRSLDLPPRLVLIDTANNVTTTTKQVPSPNTVLDGPYIMKSSPFKSFSFRVIRKDFFYGSFRRTKGSPEKGSYGECYSSKTPLMFGKKRAEFERSFLGSLSWRRKSNCNGKREDLGYIFTDSMMDKECDYGGGLSNEEYYGNDIKKANLTRTASFSSLSQSKSHFWATIYEGLKQVVPWRSRKLKKGGRGGGGGVIT